MNDPSTLFTRGAPGDADTRGESMVAKHLARKRAEQEAEALAALARALPGTSEAMLRAALEACDWDVDAAAASLRDFAAASCAAKPAAAQRERRRRHGGSGSSGDSGSSSGSSSSEDDEARGKRQRRDKDRSKKSKASGGKKEKRDKKSKKRSKKERTGKDGAPRGAVGDAQFGKYGIIKETDLWERQPEFHAWLQEVKERNPETLQKWEERDLFKARAVQAPAPAAPLTHRWSAVQEFMEDFNTATLPHKKFYSLQRWHAKEVARAAKHSGSSAQVRALWLAMRQRAGLHVTPASRGASGTHGLRKHGGRPQARAHAGARARQGTSCCHGRHITCFVLTHVVHAGLSALRRMPARR